MSTFDLQPIHQIENPLVLTTELLKPSRSDEIQSFVDSRNESTLERLMNDPVIEVLVNRAKPELSIKRSTSTGKHFFTEVETSDRHSIAKMIGGELIDSIDCTSLSLLDGTSAYPSEYGSRVSWNGELIALAVKTPELIDAEIIQIRDTQTGDIIHEFEPSNAPFFAWAEDADGKSVFMSSGVDEEGRRVGVKYSQDNHFEGEIVWNNLDQGESEYPWIDYNNIDAQNVQTALYNKTEGNDSILTSADNPNTVDGIVLFSDEENRSRGLKKEGEYLYMIHPSSGIIKLEVVNEQGSIDIQATKDLYGDRSITASNDNIGEWVQAVELPTSKYIHNYAVFNQNESDYFAVSYGNELIIKSPQLDKTWTVSLPKGAQISINKSGANELMVETQGVLDPGRLWRINIDDLGDSELVEPELVFGDRNIDDAIAGLLEQKALPEIGLDTGKRTVNIFSLDGRSLGLENKNIILEVYGGFESGPTNAYDYANAAHLMNGGVVVKTKVKGDSGFKIRSPQDRLDTQEELINVLEYLQSLGADSRKIVIRGHSNGGLNALLLSINAARRGIQLGGVFAGAPITNLVDANMLDQKWPNWESQFGSFSDPSTHDLREALSPIHQLSSVGSIELSPVAIWAGGKDKNVSPLNALMYKMALERRGVPSYLFVDNTAEHWTSLPEQKQLYAELLLSFGHNMIWNN